jgi:chromosome segregation ATPase
MFLEVPAYTASDHGMIMYFSHWLTWLIGVILAFIGVVLYGEYKIWVEIKRTHIEKNSKEAIEKEERISKAVEAILEFKPLIEKIEENYEDIKQGQSIIKLHYQETKESWSKIESDYRHIKKSLEIFNDNTPKIQQGLMEMLEEMKIEVKKVEDIKMAQDK